jgi:hypothetical protein
MNADAVGFVKVFAGTGKPVAAICHGPWTLLEAGLVRGVTLTSWPSQARARAAWSSRRVRSSHPAAQLVRQEPGELRQLVLVPADDEDEVALALLVHPVLDPTPRLRCYTSCAAGPRTVSTSRISSWYISPTRAEVGSMTRTQARQHSPSTARRWRP